MYMHVLHDFSAASHYSFLMTRLAFKLRGLSRVARPLFSVFIYDGGKWVIEQNYLGVTPDPFNLLYGILI